MFCLSVADKYASVATKNLGLGCNSWPCSAGHFLIINLSFLDMGIKTKARKLIKSPWKFKVGTHYDVLDVENKTVLALYEL